MDQELLRTALRRLGEVLLEAGRERQLPEVEFRDGKSDLLIAREELLRRVHNKIQDRESTATPGTINPLASRAVEEAVRLGWLTVRSGRGNTPSSDLGDGGTTRRRLLPGAQASCDAHVRQLIMGWTEVRRDDDVLAPAEGWGKKYDELNRTATMPPGITLVMVPTSPVNPGPSATGQNGLAESGELRWRGRTVQLSQLQYILLKELWGNGEPFGTFLIEPLADAVYDQWKRPQLDRVESLNQLRKRVNQSLQNATVAITIDLINGYYQLVPLGNPSAVS